jgi:starch-binding outer membrane protein, SusD/RagB family
MRILTHTRVRSFGSRLALALIAGTALACSSVTDTLLEAEDPDIISPGSTASPEGAIGLANGARDTFRSITGGSESTWLFGGLLADEWSTSSTFPQNDETDQRHIQENNSQVTGMLYRLHRTRVRATEAILRLKEFNETQRNLIAEMYFARGFAEMQLAQDFCNGIPLSETIEGVTTPGDPLTVQVVFERSLASYDTALTFANGTDNASVAMARAIRIARGRALLGLNRIADAATAVTGIPTSYVFSHTFSLTTGSNTIWGQGLSARRYSIGDSLEGNSRNILVRNALPFHGVSDPRLPTVFQTSLGQDGLTRPRTSVIYGQLTAVDVVNGIDARLIEAEAALKAGSGTWLTILNALRAAPPKLGEHQPAAMPALADPGNDAARLNLLFREKAFWTFSRGQRLGDLRRLVRQYGRTVDNTFPQGIHYKGGIYGPDVNFPIVTDERQNPLFNGCLDRNA